MISVTAPSRDKELMPTPRTSTRPRRTARSVGTAASQHSADRLPQDHDVECGGPVLHVVQVEPHRLLPRQIRATAHLPQPGHAWPHEETPTDSVTLLFDGDGQRAGTA